MKWVLVQCCTITDIQRSFRALKDGNYIGGMSAILPREFPAFGVLMMVLESDEYQDGPILYTDHFALARWFF